MRTLVFGISLFFVLISCAPSPAGRVEVDQFAGSVSYFPMETGISWAYLPEGASLDSFQVQVSVAGPTVIDGDIWIASQIFGAGLRGVRYRQYRPDGVFILREIAPGTQITHEPPIQEYPASESLRVGMSWGGDTRSTILFTDRNQTVAFDVNYVYTIVDRRKVRLQAGEFEVFVINLTGRRFDENGSIAEEFSHDVWFAPYFGEVRTREGYVLVSSNLLSSSSAP